MRRTSGATIACSRWACAGTIVPPETQAELRQALPQVEIVTLPGLGHYPSDEQPAEFLEIVDRLLKR